MHAPQPYCCAAMRPERGESCLSSAGGQLPGASAHSQGAGTLAAPTPGVSTRSQGVGAGLQHMLYHTSRRVGAAGARLGMFFLCLAGMAAHPRVLLLATLPLLPSGTGAGRQQPAHHAREGDQEANSRREANSHQATHYMIKEQPCGGSLCKERAWLVRGVGV